MAADLVADNRIGSIQSLVELLGEVIRRPNSDEARLLEPHLKTQGTLAKFTCVDRGILGCSLNTLKRSAFATPGGFSALNDLRQRAKVAIDATQVAPDDAPANTKEQLQARVQKFRDNLATANEDLMLLTRLLEKAMRQGRLYAKDSKQASLIERCTREQAEIRDMMTLRQTLAAPLRVVS